MLLTKYYTSFHVAFLVFDENQLLFVFPLQVKSLNCFQGIFLVFPSEILMMWILDYLLQFHTYLRLCSLFCSVHFFFVGESGSFLVLICQAHEFFPLTYSLLLTLPIQFVFIFLSSKVCVCFFFISFFSCPSLYFSVETFYFFFFKLNTDGLQLLKHFCDECFKICQVVTVSLSRCWRVLSFSFLLRSFWFLVWSFILLET